MYDAREASKKVSKKKAASSRAASRSSSTLVIDDEGFVAAVGGHIDFLYDAVLVEVHEMYVKDRERVRALAVEVPPGGGHGQTSLFVIRVRSGDEPKAIVENESKVAIAERWIRGAGHQLDDDMFEYMLAERGLGDGDMERMRELRAELRGNGEALAHAA